MTGVTPEVQDPYGLLKPELREDPYPSYARLHREAPMHYSEGLGAWVAVRYEEVNAAFRDTRLSSGRTSAFSAGLPDAVRQKLIPLGRNLASWAMLMDPPSHTRLRSLINKAFTPRMAEALRPRVRALVEELLDGVAPRGRMDVIADLSAPLPVRVIGELLGLPREDGPRLKRWSDKAALFIGAGRPTLERAEGALEAIVELEDYYRGFIAERRKTPGNDLLSALVHAEEQGNLLSEQELLSTLTMVLFGGHETMTNLIGLGLLALLRHPEQAELLRGEPERMAHAVEELLRFDSPVQRASRLALEDVEMGGQVVRKGQRVWLMMGAANRDPSQFREPDRLDVRREDVRHLSFAMGPHYCVGAALARMEAQEVFGALLRRFPRMRLEEGAALQWLDTAVFRGVHSLPVVLGPAA
jgi:hypothetical protein